MNSRIKDLATRCLVRFSGPVPPREMLQRLREDDRGMMSTEMAIALAIIVFFTVGVVTFIGTQILNKAHGFHF